MRTALHSRRNALSALTTATVGGSLLLTGIPALAWQMFGGKTVTASGRVKVEARTVGAFHAVAVSIPGSVELIQGGSEGLRLEADDNLPPVIETVIDNGELLAKGVQVVGSSHIKVTVHAATVDSLSVAGSANLQANRLQTPRLEASIAGSGNITIRDLQNERLSVSIAGSGDFEARGAGQAVDVSIAGSGNLRAPNFSAQSAKVSIAGSGNATVWVRKTLAVSIVGSGDVRYYGEGALQGSSVMGSGQIRALGGTPPAA
ncbi:MAG: DUF2807 domain-containing protein [Burkholderiales bacterium]|nr:DUF2807 domain-containing protein [Burkholderiales bacterium]